MAYQTNFHLTQPFSVALRRWWSRPMVTIPPSSERACTNKECAAMCAPCFGGLLTLVAVYLIFLFIDKAHSHAKISLQSLAVSSTTWQGDFLVKIPSSRYSIYYDVDEAAVRLGSLNAAVLNITSERVSRDDTAFSLFSLLRREIGATTFLESLRSNSWRSISVMWIMMKLYTLIFGAKI
ncbi:hypothetical protein Bca52824_004731 [Brassica carinata]|uniref:Uncharacterized protein n=1 Tax=Brassica carinata TaxID=52824 RepID=A0A8X7WPJ5_BRACI|nr:hypothetical protein Bca52824_004731 [Brassica carinata]